MVFTHPLLGFILLIMKAFYSIRTFMSAIVALIALNVQAQIKIVDSESSEPIDFASVFDNETGKVVGLTTVEGHLPTGAEKLKSISIQHINYNTCNINPAELQDTIVKMTPFSRELKDVKISKDPKAKIRVKIYTRTYTYINGMIALVNFDIGYLYFKNATSKSSPKYTALAGKVFGDYPLLKAQSNFILTLASITEPGDFADFNLCLKYDELKGGKRLHDSWKRAGTVTYMNEDSIKKRCEIVADSSFYDKPFTFFIIPFSIGKLYTSETYSTAYGAPRLYDLQNKITMFRAIRKKTKEYVDVVQEIFVGGVDYATKEDIKNDKLPSNETIEWPKDLPEMNQNITKALKNMQELTLTREDKNEKAEKEEK